MNRFKNKEEYLEFLNNSSNKELLNSLESDPYKLLKELKDFSKELKIYNNKNGKNESKYNILIPASRLEKNIKKNNS